MMHVVKPGMLSTIQDLGRYGQQRLGVPVSGVMDEWSHRIANMLVGNDANAATLEMTLTGATVRFDRDVLIALGGAARQARVDSVPVPMQRALLVRASATLSVGACTGGARAYLAVRGGFAVTPVLGSRSTFTRGGFGGVDGRALRAGDRIAIEPGDVGYPLLHAALLRGDAPFIAGPALPIAGHPGLLRALRFTHGPQWDHFTRAAQADFIGSDYRIDARSDRMGYRLTGPVLKLRAPLEMISEPVDMGTIQVPPDGQPIVLMAERSSAGGYPKIGYVASADLSALAQAMPGQTLGFEAVDVDTAVQAYLDNEETLARIRHTVRLTLRDCRLQ